LSPISRSRRQRDIPGISAFRSLDIPSFFQEELNKGHSRIPHSYREALFAMKLEAGVQRVFEFLYQKSVGTHFKPYTKKPIGTPTIAKVCFLYRRSVTRAIAGLVEWNMIRILSATSKGKIFLIELDPAKWKRRTDGYPERHSDGYPERHSDGYPERHGECLPTATPLIRNNSISKKEKKEAIATITQRDLTKLDPATKAIIEKIDRHLEESKT
jgi:hypothetical protein